VKGFLSFNPLAFTHVLPDVTTSAVRGVAVWKLFGFVFTIFMVYFGEELATFGYLASVLFYGNLTLF
jgi:uncharacterized BrkB/YihY/UPF0761 family membrane protein